MSTKTRFAFLAGDSAMARLMREKDWSGTALDSPAQWPQSLRSVVNLVLGSAFPMFVCWGPQLGTLYNDAYATILGEKHPDALGQPFMEIWSEISADLQPLVARPLAGESFYMENLPLRMRRHGFDEDTWFTFSYAPVLDEDGRNAGLHCACVETTQSVLTQQQLRARQEWLQSLFQQAPGFAAVLRGPDHVFEMVNEAYLQLTGHRELVGKAVAQALPEIVDQGFIGLLDGVHANGVPFVGHSIPVSLNRIPGAPATEVFVDFVYQPLMNGAGQVDSIFVQGHEVTEHHKMQRTLREADRQKDEFLATLAHELRNPLAPIRTAVHLLASPAAGEAARMRATDVIGRQVGHMARLLDDLIDIARITQRKLVLRKEIVSAGSIMDAAMEAAQPLADAKRHTLTATIDDRAALLDADPVRLAQVLSNLLNNASKYTDAGGRITLDVRAEGRWLTFSVTDSGIGLEPDAIDKVFAMFSQEQSALDRSEGGLGIGLALAKGLVDLHGGTLTATSEGAGRGSRFVVRLPRAAVAVVPEPDGIGAGPAAAAGSPLASRTVLLADDNRDAADVMAEILRMGGHVVHTANDGIQAAELAMQLQPDVLVLDIGMPGLNGYEVARRIRAQPWGRRPLLIAATGWGREDDRQQALEAGFDLHLTKPFDPEQLSELIAVQAG